MAAITIKLFAAPITFCLDISFHNLYSFPHSEHVVSSKKKSQILIMCIANLLKKLRYGKKLSTGQVDHLLALHEKRIFSIHRELRFFLYIGILLIIAGAGLTIKQYFTNLGDIAISSALTLCFAAAFIYCFLNGNAFAKDEVASPNIAFDYVLFFGCTFFSMDIAYIETQFHVLGELWNNYLLVSSALFIFLAYRFDNRLVLSLTLSTIAAWFGFTLSGHRFSFEEYYREYAIAYSLIILLLGGLLYRVNIKKHFFDIYLNFAVHFLCIALISGVAQYKIFSLYFPGLLLACAALAFYSVKVRKFIYILYAVIYGYIGTSIIVVVYIKQDDLVYLYFIVTSLMIIGLTYAITRKFKEGK